MAPGRAETPLEAASRIATAGRVRIDEQRALIDRLNARGYGHLMAHARALLAVLLTAQRVAEAHLKRLDPNRSGGKDRRS